MLLLPAILPGGGFSEAPPSPSTNTNLAAYYRLGDIVNSFAVLDSSGNDNNGSLIGGSSGDPAYGFTGAFLYDPNTALDLTNGSNILNGGFTTNDFSTNPPTVQDPLGGAGETWSMECWIQWTSTATSIPGFVRTFTGDLDPPWPSYILQTPANTAGLAKGDAVAGTGILAGTTITGISTSGDTAYYHLSKNWTPAASVTGAAFAVTSGGVGSTLFAAAETASYEVDVRIGTFFSGSVASYNNLLVGPVLDNALVPTLNGALLGTNPLDGNWHHIVITYSASVVTGYLDGVSAGSVATMSSWADPTTITVGCNVNSVSGAPQNGWVGAMQDVALYSAALTPAQIINHYKLGTLFRHVETGTEGPTARLDSILTVSGLPLSMLNAPYPFRTNLYGETNSVTTTSGLNYLQTLTESEPGLIFQGPNGAVNAYSRQYQYLNPSSTTSQAIFGDSAAASVLHYDGPSFQLIQDDLDTWNTIQVQSGRSGELGAGAALALVFGLGSSGATLQQVTSPQSASVYGSRTLQGLTSLQMEYDSDALAIAQQYLGWYAFPLLRVTTLMIDSYGNQGLQIPYILTLGLFDRVTIQYQGQTPGPQYSHDFLIEQIQHQINMIDGPIWTTAYATSLYEIINEPMIFNDWTFGTPASVAGMTL